MADNKNKTNFKSPKKGSNILCRVSNPTAEMVVKYVNRLPKEIMAEDKFRSIMGTSWFSNEHQAPEQWGLYYIDGTTYYPRFSRDITEQEAERYLNGWLKRLIVINPYTKFKVSNDNGLVISIVKHLVDFPHIKDLKTIIRDIINSKEPFIVNDILANTLNKYSEVLDVTTIDKDKELFDVKLLPDYQDIISKKYMKKKDYFHLFDGIVDDTIDTNFQTIFFGTPGSGKSHKVGKIVEGHDEFTFRTTFHPDSDYATFVGAYKPVKDGKDLTYEFVPQAFTDAYVKAWNFPEEEIYLVIEEINRGNCAQIFGDLFQLLDRDKHNVSEYPINADKDLRKYLETDGILGEGHEGIKDGKLKLPANFHILATMNTSDQSLFPMDSAFKRRWSWEYVPIDLDNEDSQFVITIGDKKYPWVSFLKEVNERIHKLSDSEDKQMGNFFIKSDIDVEEFKSKVMFYLWSEVCKDYEKSGSFFKDADKDDAEFTFNSLFPTNDTTNKRLQGFMKYLGVAEKQPDAAAAGATKVESGETPQS